MGLGDWVGDRFGELGGLAGGIIGERGDTVIRPGSAPAPAPTPIPEGGTGWSINDFGKIAANVSNRPGASSGGGTDPVSQIMSATGYSRAQALELLSSANGGNINSQRILASIGIEPFASTINGAGGGSGGSSGGSGGGGGGLGSVWSPTDQAGLDRLNLQNRQLGALFDPNYPDGALIPLADGTKRINGTEIIIDDRVQGQYKPVQGAPGYMVDPVSGNIIDTNGNQIRREELSETIRSNRAAEGISNRRLDLDTELGRFDSDLAAELGRGNLALDTTLGVGRLNFDAAATENEQALRNILETNGLNLDSFLGTGNLNVNATNAETNRLSALTNRTSAAGDLASRNQALMDARTNAVIGLMANPQDFVQREYATRALLEPPGYTGPAFREDPRVGQAIDKLMQDPDVSGLLPTYQAPQFAPAVLPNASLGRVTAPTPQPQAVRTPVTTQPKDINGAAYSNTNVTPANQPASDHFRQVGVPDWALAPLGYAEGTEGTTEDEFIVGDPQSDGQVNPELVEIHNPGPKTTAEVTPLRDMFNAPQFAEGTGKSKNKKSAMGNNPDRFEGFSEFMREMFDNLPRVYMQYDMLRQQRDNDKYREDSWQQVPSKSKVSADYDFDINPDMPLDTTQIDDRRLPTTATDFRPKQSMAGSGGMSRFLEDLDLEGFAYGTNYGGQSGNPYAGAANTPLGNANPNSTPSTPALPNTNNPNNPYAVPANAGPIGTSGSHLGTLTSYNDQEIQGMPNIQYALGNIGAVDYNALNTGKINGPFGTKLPDVGGLNYGQLLNIQQDPDSWGTLSSIYRAANRDLAGIFNRVQARAPIGNITQRSMIRT